jgi:hypothetical protein
MAKPLKKPSAVYLPNASQAGATATVTWSPSLRCFTGQTRAMYLTPYSGLFLSHFMAELGTLLAPVPQQSNPFFTTILPLAYTDDLLMHCLMALSGAHMSSHDQQTRPETQNAIARHYAGIVSSLRTALPDLKAQETEKVLRVLLTLILLAYYEVVSPLVLRHLAIVFLGKLGLTLGRRCRQIA